MKIYKLPKTNQKKLSTSYYKKSSRMYAKQQILKELNDIFTENHRIQVLVTNFTENFKPYCDNCHRLQLNACSLGCAKSIIDIELEEEKLSDLINSHVWYNYVIN